MHRVHGSLLVLVLLSACASSPLAPSATASRSGRCPTPQRRAPLAASTEAAPVMQQPATLDAPARAPVAPSVDEDESCEASAPDAVDAIDAQEAIIAEGQRALAAGAAECRDICRAAGNICTAAGEVCRLAGDAHARCARARGACTDAGRRRDGACPVCPALR